MHPTQDSPSETTRVDNHFKNAMSFTVASILMKKTVVKISLHYDDGDRERRIHKHFISTG